MLDKDERRTPLRLAGLALGPVVFLVLLMFPSPELLGSEAWRVIATFAWMLTWWLTEAVPIPATAVLPIILLPGLGVSDIRDVASPYASPVIFLFLGGFLLALAIEKWNLHLRISLAIIRFIGTRADRVIAGFMLASALLSMWISNTATAVMMLPIALSVIEIMFKGKPFNRMSRGERNFSLSLLLSIAYSANIGGTATLIGTPPNAVLAGLSEQYYDTSLDFVKWMFIGVPFMLVMLASAWLLLVKVLFPSKIGRSGDAVTVVNQKYAEIGKMSRPEKRVAGVFLFTAFCWIFKIQINALFAEINAHIPIGIGTLSDHSIAMLGGLLLFIVSSSNGEPLLKWKDTRRLPWGILLLFGGGLTMAASFEKVGIINLIGEYIADTAHLSVFVLLLMLTFVSLSLTEVMSNVALITAFIPVVFGIANGLGIEPMMLAIPVTLASSCAFTMPISTPLNAVVFSSGYIQVHHMLKAGALLNVFAIMLTVLVGYYLVGWVF